jgi:F-type H+-transporting ATPase subunit delta
MAATIQHETVLDTGQQQLGLVYAKALVAAAEDAGIGDQVLEELDSFVELLDQLPSLEGTLASPRVPVEVKLSTLDKVVQGKCSATLSNFLKVVCRRRRFECIRAIHRATHERFNELTGRVVVQVTSAAPLDEAIQQRLAERLGTLLQRQVVIRLQIDPELIGGLVVRVGDTRYDASLANQLLRLRDSVVERAAAAIRESSDRFEVREA